MADSLAAHLENRHKPILRIDLISCGQLSILNLFRDPINDFFILRLLLCHAISQLSYFLQSVPPDSRQHTD